VTAVQLSLALASYQAAGHCASGNPFSAGHAARFRSNEYLTQGWNWITIRLAQVLQEYSLRVSCGNWKESEWRSNGLLGQN
jgi:hypothetical protein